MIESRNIVSNGEIARQAAIYWGLSSGIDTIRDLSHWAGEGRWANEEAWKAIGELHFQIYEQMCQMTGRDVAIQSMLEWGPGGGANATRFADHCQQFYGVDISEANLKECGRQLGEREVDYQSLLIDVANPESVGDAVTTPLDFFLCTAVYQHFPSRSYGQRVTKTAHSMLKEGALALIQIRYDNGKKKIGPKVGGYAKNAIHYTTYRQKEFSSLVQRAGFEILDILIDPEPSYAFYLLQKK